MGYAADVEGDARGEAGGVKQGKTDFFHTGDDWSAIPVPGTGTMMLLPPDWMEAGDSGETATAGQVACPWCEFFTAQEAVCDRCGSPIPAARSSFWSLIDAAS